MDAAHRSTAPVARETPVNIIRTALRGAVLAAALLAPAIAPAFEKTHYRTLDVDGVNVFYR